ncbi:hypothetical protein [Bartonella harrusi]|uniref:Phage related protein n=1 Tax=Bartonella harrusi TaxID=2961895 RepID=A0ABY5EU93_9HYPH|nr:hypothetical protein [Bartonella harrusi]UTO28000.1 hypothetical protein NMK50_07180 [Bartonella harrusi]
MFGLSNSLGWSNTAGLLYRGWSSISSMNFSTSGSQAGCTVGDYLSTTHSSGMVGFEAGGVAGGFVGDVIGGISTGGAGVGPGIGTGIAIGSIGGYGTGALLGLGSRYDACYY